MPAEGLEYWYQALGASGPGICIYASDRQRMVQKLYAARAEAKDPDLDSLSIVPSPTDDSNIWIVKRGMKPSEGADAKRETE